MAKTSLKDMNFRELQDECRDREIPFKDAPSAEELRKRLSRKKGKD